MSPIATHLIALLVGVFIGASGQYFADRFTDQRRAQEGKRKSSQRFAEVEALMPALSAEMRQDVLADTTGTRREFFPYNIGVIFSPGPDKFFYEPQKHPDIVSQLVVLENNGYVIQVTEALYRMTEKFVTLLKS
jgi:hypothetical protein